PAFALLLPGFRNPAGHVGPIETRRGSMTLIITGASRGIGAATARLAARRGYDVCINYARDEAAAMAVLTAIRADGDRAIAVRADVRSEENVKRHCDTTEARRGPLRGLSNNAGITGPIGRCSEVETATLEKVLAVNVLGTMLCAREAARRLEAAGRGAIVNLSSVAATTGAPGEYVHYAASKAAIDAFTVGLARELAGSSVRVNAVAPG